MLFQNYLPRRLVPHIQKELKLDSRRFITEQKEDATILTFFFCINEDIQKAKMQLHIHKKATAFTRTSPSK